MSESACTATTRDGRPCAARPLPGGDFCLFHDPNREPLLAQSRSKGGATPRRRTRRYPRMLDYKHVAELLSELLIDALNESAPLDAQRLRALTGLSSVLLKAVGRPKNTYELHQDRSEPAADEACLRRLHPPDPPELALLLAADAEIETELAAAAPAPDPADPSDPSDPSNPSAPSDPLPAAEPRSAAPQPGGARPHLTPSFSRQEEPEQEAEQGRNRTATGTSATDPFLPDLAITPPCEPDPGASAAGEAGSQTPDPSPQTPPPASVSPGLRGENSSPDTLSVPGVPILISFRRVPGPFG